MGVFKGSPLGELARIRNVTTRRISSWDRTGGNMDFLVVQPGQQVTLANIEGAGCINHIWCTHACEQEDYLRRVVLRARWDDESEYSIETPLGDFFGVGHAKTVNFSSMPLQMSPSDGRGFNCWFPMPFGKRAEFFLHNEADVPLNFYYYIDFELHDAIPEDMGRFHAQWRRENPTQGITDEELSTLIKETYQLFAATNPALTQAPKEVLRNLAFEFGGKNIGGKGNYVILEAEGTGHYVGCNLNIHNLRTGDEVAWPEDKAWPRSREEEESSTFEDRMEFLRVFNWYGEGDDMIFIDGEEWPPSLHGTGTEDYFNTAYCPAQKYDSLYHGMTLPGGPNWSGKSSYYRFHIEDPIHFRKSIKVTIEHGHNNNRSDDISSTAYWYQMEPHKPFPMLPPVEKRLPLKG
ncbi:glycoside hydrolase family 172 protein [Caldilinea sp.]|jgi:hypothetical protein|uniref:glycoside hydrolase family 172 protein n=1 Tax=Caldilinea sp. TaxID=2293560 RepID=UPI0021DC8525|nr:glycoside hydrolase family 172 protein [Caldilinea sp.]GIV70395.1 MAG: hypothetical protein KatS3mg048_3257 [Caldilinea sp.]